VQRDAPVTTPLCLDVSRICLGGRIPIQPATGTKPPAPLRLEPTREEKARVIASLSAQLAPEAESFYIDSAEVVAPRNRNIPDGLAGIAWAIRNPTQAWRIFLPVPQ
jgi:hypothetical protein